MNPRAGGGITVSTPRNHCVVGMREKKKKKKKKKKAVVSTALKEKLIITLLALYDHAIEGFFHVGE